MPYLFLIGLFYRIFNPYLIIMQSVTPARSIPTDLIHCACGITPEPTTPSPEHRVRSPRHPARRPIPVSGYTNHGGMKGRCNRPKRKSPAGLAGLPSRRGELRCGVPVVCYLTSDCNPTSFQRRAEPIPAKRILSTSRRPTRPA